MSDVASKNAPKYIQIYHQLKLNILSNRYDVDGRFPAESELMQQYQVSRTTIRRAMNMLREENMIESRQGHGTEVLTHHRVLNSGQSNRLTNVQRVDFRFIPSPVESTKHSETLIDVVPVHDDAAAALQVEPGSSAYRIRWLHFVNDMPYLYLTNYVRMDLAPNLPDHVSGMVSLYPILAQHCGLTFLQAEETLTPIVSDFITARLLEVPVNTPLLLLCRSAQFSKGPAEYSRSIIRPDLMQISLFIK